MADREGFLEGLGLPRINESQALDQARKYQTDFGGTQVGAFMSLGRQLGRGIAPAVAGAASGIGGLVSGEGGRGFREFGRDFAAGAKNLREQQVAAAVGMTPAEYQSHKRLRERVSKVQYDPDGDLEARLRALKKIASIAMEEGDIEVAMNAARQETILKAQAQELRAAGLESDLAEERLSDAREEDEFGKTMRRVTDDPKNGYGKGVRITEGPDYGKYRYMDKQGREEIVDPIELTTQEQDDAGSGSGRLAKWQSLPGLAADNGATSARIGDMRNVMSGMGQQAQIMTNIASNLNALSDPQAALSATGQVAIGADKTVSFVESVSTMLSGPGSGTSLGDISWNGKKVSSGEQYRQIQNLGKDENFLIRALKKAGGVSNDLDDYVPEAIRGNAQAAELYWANVMELAYLDARLQEPSNRGLSDADIENALKRLGASSANPVTMATRMLEIIDTKLLPGIENIGLEFQTHPDSQYSRDDVRDFVYAPRIRERVMGSILDARMNVMETIGRGRRGEGPAVEAAPTGSPVSTMQSYFE